MRRLAYLLLLAIAPFTAGAQAYGRIDFSLQNAQGPAISGATINVLAQSACGVTASGQAQLYSSATGGAITQPLHTNGFGHAFAYTLPGCVTIVYSSPSTGTLTYPDQTVFSGTGAYCTISDCAVLITPAQDLQSAITAAGANGQMQLSCGTFNVASGLTIPNSGLHMKGLGRDCTFVNFTTVTGLSVSGTNVEIDGITFEGQTGPYSVQATPTATSFRFHDNAVTQAGQGASTYPQTALWIQAPSSDALIERNDFYGNGPVGGQPAGYTVLFSGQTTGYVTGARFIDNHVHANNQGIAVAGFDCTACIFSLNKIDQNDAYYTLAEGTGYALMLYSSGYNSSTTSLSRTANVVTIVVPTQPAGWVYTVGETVMLTAYANGTNGTNFNGVFTLATVSGSGPYTLTWAQPAADDALVSPAGTIQPPLQHLVVTDNKISNSSGGCLYLQGVAAVTVTGNQLSQCDLDIVPFSLPHSGIGVGGLWGGTISGNSVDTVGHSSAVSLNHSYDLALGNNSLQNANKDGVRLFDNYRLNASGNKLAGNADGGFVGQSTTGINCYKCSFPGNDITLAPSTGGYFFQGTDQYNNVTGGAVHAGASGLGNAGAYAKTGTANITFDGLQVDCYADKTATSTLNFGIESQGTEVVIKNSPIKGCAVAGIFDAGTNDTVQGNKVSASTLGVTATTSTGLTLKDNTLFGNTSAYSLGGATNLINSGNQTAVGTYPPLQTSLITFSDGSTLSTAFYTGPTYTFGSDAGIHELFNLNSAAGTQRLLGWLTASVARWSCGADSDAESGGNAGSPFRCRAYDDAGTAIDAWLSVVRAAGGAETHTRPMVLSAISGSTQCLHVNSVGLITGTGSDCGAAGTATQLSTTGANGTFWGVSGGTQQWLTPSGVLPAASTHQQLFTVDTGSTAHLLTEANSQINAVFNEGIDNSGAGDMSTALTAVTTAMCALSNPPPLYLPAGAYKINSGWLIGATSTTCGYMTIIGSGAGTILKTDCSGNSYGLWYNNTTNSGDNFQGIRIEHLQIQDTSGTGACQDLLKLTQVARVIVNDVTVSGAKGQAYSTGTVASTGATVTGTGTTWTAAMSHGYLMTTSGTTTTRAEICAVGGATSITLCSNAFPTGNIAGGTSYAIAFAGRGITCDPGNSFSQYISIHDSYAPGNLIGFDAMGSNSGSNGCSRVTIDGSAHYIAQTPGARVTNSVGMWLGRQADTIKVNSAINNVAACYVMDSAHSWQINGECEDNSTYAPVTTCNGGVGTQNCTVAAEVSSDANGSGWSGSFLNMYAYLVGTVYQYDNATGAFNTQILGDRTLSGQYTTHYSFSGATGCPGNASGIKAVISTYDCNHQLVAQTVN